MRRRRYRRNVSLRRVAYGRAARKLGGLRPKLIGAAAGAVGGALLTVAAGAAQNVSPMSALPKNAFVGAVGGLVATLLGARPLVAALVAGTSIYLVNSLRAGISGGGA